MRFINPAGNNAVVPVVQGIAENMMKVLA